MRGPRKGQVERQLLFAAGIRYFSDFHNYRVGAVAHVLLRNLQRMEDQGKKATLAKVTVTEDFATPIRLTHADALEAIVELEAQGLVEWISQAGGRKFWELHLTVAGREHLSREDDASSEIIDRVCGQLLGDLPEPRGEWRNAFLATVCMVFATLGREYASILAGRGALTELLDGGMVLRLARREARGSRSVDETTLAHKVEEFLRDTGPEATELKWHLAHGYYLLVALGLGQANLAFSDQFFAGKVLYFDTNVLFPAVLEHIPRHASFLRLAQVCHHKGVPFLVAKPTADEFSRSIARQVDDISKVGAKVPQMLSGQVTDPVYIELQERMQERPGVDAADMLKELSNPQALLAASGLLTVVEDPWFAIAQRSEDVTELAQEVNNQYVKLKGRKKGMAIARHDALLLLYVANERADGRDALFVTLDTTLAHCRGELIERKGNVCLSLDALLQLTAAAIDGGQSTEIADVFSSALAERLLPMHNQLSVSDFRLLDDFGYQCDTMAEARVIDCLQHLHSLLRNTDPSTAEGREKLQHSMRKYFLAPERSHQVQLDDTRRQLGEAKTRLGTVEQRNRALVCILVGLVAMIVGLVVAYFLGAGKTVGERFRTGFSALGLPGFLSLLWGLWRYARRGGS